MPCDKLKWRICVMHFYGWSFFASPFRSPKLNRIRSFSLDWSTCRHSVHLSLSILLYLFCFLLRSVSLQSLSFSFLRWPSLLSSIRFWRHIFCPSPSPHPFLLSSTSFLPFSVVLLPFLFFAKIALDIEIHNPSRSTGMHTSVCVCMCVCKVNDSSAINNLHFDKWIKR